VCLLGVGVLRAASGVDLGSLLGCPGAYPFLRFDSLLGSDEGLAGSGSDKADHEQHDQGR
jgi:hypothetical protein